MNPYEAVQLLMGVRDRLRRQIRLEEFYRQDEPRHESEIVINGGLYVLAPRPPSKLRREVRALEQAMEAVRPKEPRRRKSSRRLIHDLEVEEGKPQNPFAPEKLCPK